MTEILNNVMQKPCDPVTPLLKTLQWLSLTLQVKHNLVAINRRLAPLSQLTYSACPALVSGHVQGHHVASEEAKLFFISGFSL